MDPNRAENQPFDSECSTKNKQKRWEVTDCEIDYLETSMASVVFDRAGCSSVCRPDQARDHKNAQDNPNADRGQEGNRAALHDKSRKPVPNGWRLSGEGGEVERVHCSRGLGGGRRFTFMATFYFVRSAAVGGPSTQFTSHARSTVMNTSDPAGNQASCTILAGM
jgi:hypothetical protein